MASDSTIAERVSISDADRAPARSGARRGRRWYVRLAQVLGIVVGLLVAAVGVEQLLYSNRILPGVQVDGVRVGQKTNDAARDALADHAATLESEPIVATVGEQQLTIAPADVGLQVDADATYEAARDAGRTDLLPWERLGAPFARIGSGKDVPWRVSYDTAKVDAILQQWEAQQVTGLVPGDVTFAGGTVAPVMPAVGTTVDAAAARAPIDAALRSGTREPVELPTKPVPPVLTDADVQAVADERERGAVGAVRGGDAVGHAHHHTRTGGHRPRHHAPTRRYRPRPRGRSRQARDRSRVGSRRVRHRRRSTRASWSTATAP